MPTTTRALLGAVLASTLLATSATGLEANRPFVAEELMRPLWSAAVDTCWLLGGDSARPGTFQDVSGTLPDAQGWVGADLTVESTAHWQVDAVNAELLDPLVAPNHAMWCGAHFTPCQEGDPTPGYGNSWREWLDWYRAVPNPAATTTVRVTARLNHDLEADYDFARLQVDRSWGMEDLAVWTGANRVPPYGSFAPVDVDVVFTVNPADYVGGEGDLAHLRWEVTSDGNASDEDCRNPTVGALQVDNIAVYFNDARQTGDDFEGGTPSWGPTIAPGVGGFARVWPRLADIDPMGGNSSPQFAFIDDGEVVPGTGGSIGVTWTYGPGGHVDNLTGGLAGPSGHLANEIWSPSLAWPPGDWSGAVLEFDAYTHLPKQNGLCFTWRVRSSADGETWTPWRDHGRAYLGEPRYGHFRVDVSDVLLAGRTRVQVALGAVELGWLWGLEGTDGTPAPCFDNVSLRAERRAGPAIYSRGALLAADAFPEAGAVDLEELGANNVRFDAEAHVEFGHWPGYDKDKIYARVVANRPGSTLLERPRLCYKLWRNPLFDPCRWAGMPDSTSVEGDSALAIPEDGWWQFDLPDNGFLYPGDVLRYWILARDNVGKATGKTTLPQDASFLAAGCNDTTTLCSVPTIFQMTALPCLIAGRMPSILLWIDGEFGDAVPAEWDLAMDGLGYHHGTDYDLFVTNEPGSPLGGGLGAAATLEIMANYQTLIYSGGNPHLYTLCDGTENASDDIGLLSAWLETGNRTMLLTGDHLADDLATVSAATQGFLSRWLGVSRAAGAASGGIYEHIGSQWAPAPQAITPPPAPVLSSLSRWIAYGASFDAVTPLSGVPRLAEFPNRAGMGGVYPYAAATLRVDAATGSRSVFLPYDLSAVWTHPSDPGSSSPLLPARARLLGDVLTYFGHAATHDPIGVPSASVFAVRSWPNPFNPSVRFAWDLPAAGLLSLCVYDLRGRLVRALLEERRTAGPGEAAWDGTDGRGRAAPSGAYFWEARAGGERRVGKMVLIR